MYFYRCTEQQLEEHLKLIAEAGDEVLTVLFKGGRDYVLVCRKADQAPALLTLTPEALGQLITAAVARGIRDSQRTDSHRTRVSHH